MTEMEIWCTPHECSASVCDGPHWMHDCYGDVEVTAHVDNVCRFCGQEPPLELPEPTVEGPDPWPEEMSEAEEEGEARDAVWPPEPEYGGEGG